MFDNIDFEYTSDELEIAVKNYKFGYERGAKQARTMTPVSEPPKKSDYYLVYIRDKDYQTSHYCATTEKWGTPEVEYWMELPELPK